MFLVLVFASFVALSLTHSHGEKGAILHHHNEPQQELDPSYKHCPVSRDNITMELAVLDADGDGMFSPCEIQQGKEALLDYFQRFLAWFYSIEKIMCDCDFDRDGLISYDDMKKNYKTCLVTCEKAILLDAVIVQKAKKLDYKPDRHYACDLKPKDYICKEKK